MVICCHCMTIFYSILCVAVVGISTCKVEWDEYDYRVALPVHILCGCIPKNVVWSKQKSLRCHHIAHALFALKQTLIPNVRHFVDVTKLVPIIYIYFYQVNVHCNAQFEKRIRKNKWIVYLLFCLHIFSKWGAWNIFPQVTDPKCKRFMAYDILSRTYHASSLAAKL
jgi:hypothetical protein